MAVSFPLRLRFPFRGVAFKPIARSASSGRLNPPRVLQKSKSVVASEFPLQLSFTPRQIESWNPRQADVPLVKQIESDFCDDRKLSEAIDALDLLVQLGVSIEKSLLYRVLKRCVKGKNLALGRHVHAIALKGGYMSDTFLSNHIIRMYTSHGRLHEATQVFDSATAPDTFMWYSIISAHVDLGQCAQAIGLYHQMRQSTLQPNSYVFVAVVKACACAADLASGKEIHADVLRSAFEYDIFVGSCLVDMYVKCGSLEDARRVFDRLPTKDVVTWTSMIAGYARSGLGQEALTLYASMQDGMTPNNYTFSCLLQACASIGALRQGKLLHSQIQERGLEADLVIGNCLVEMYAKCGNIKEARTVFDRLPKKDVVTWTALLNGYAEHSDAQMAIRCFRDMQQQGVEPDGGTFVCLLVACSHGGMVNEGQHYFQMMVDGYGITPSNCHYNCMVDLLGRSGCLDEAERILQKMPFNSSVVGWKSLLSACKSHGDLQRGRRCFNRVVMLEPETSTAYVLLASMYANAGRWRDAGMIEGLRKYAGAQKKPARACIEVENKVHEFNVGEERADTSSKLKSMNLRLHNNVAQAQHTELVLNAAAYNEKGQELCGHAEKLALAYGLLNTADGTPLLVTKNLRMCNSCHSATKIMSQLEKREIIVRDAHRVHHFMDGVCSCGDRQ